MSETVHPFAHVTLRRLQQTHPRFLDRLDLAKIRADMDRQRARLELGPEARKLKDGAR